MIYPDLFMWIAVVVAGIMCGSARALATHRAGDLSPARRFVGSYASVPILAVGLIFIIFVGLCVVAGFTGRLSDSDFSELPFTLVLAAGFGLFFGALIGIPSAAISCMLIKDLRIRRNTNKNT